MRQPTLQQLRHLVALARFGHFGRAARAVHATQSTLSASLKQLEVTLGAALVDRTKRQVVLTPLGESTVKRAREVLDAVAELTQAARRESEPLTGTLRLGIIPTIGPYLLPRALPPLRRVYPRLKIYLTEDLTDRLLTMLREGAIDAALIALPWECGTVDRALLFDDAFLLACRQDHALARATTIDPARLRSEGLLLLQDGHCLRDHALSACRLGARPHVAAFEGTSLHTLVQMVDNGLGVTLLPEMAVSAGITRGTRLVTRPLGGAAPKRQVVLVWRRGSGRAGEFALLARELSKSAVKPRPHRAA